MKKTLSIILALATLFSLCVSVGAAGCSHNYTAVHCDANCVSAEHTVYTCSLCGDTYTKYAWEHDDTGDFTLLFETVRDDTAGTLTLNSTMLNNPGLLTAVVKVAFDDTVLSPVSFSNGVIWDDSDIGLGSGTINLQKRPLNVYFEHASSNDPVRGNGAFFSVEFEILDPDGAYGFQFIANPKNFVDFNAVYYPPTVVDKTGKRELGGHVYDPAVTSPTCTEAGYTTLTCRFCRHTEQTDAVDPLGHVPGAPTYIQQATIYEAGYIQSLCTRCGEEVRQVIPALERWRKGDLNNDDKINAVDANLMLMLVLGISTDVGVQMTDAADINSDEKTNPTDMNMLKQMIMGS